MITKKVFLYSDGVFEYYWVWDSWHSRWKYLYDPSVDERGNVIYEQEMLQYCPEVGTYSKVPNCQLKITDHLV